MTHKDFITKVAEQLEWPEEKISGFMETFIEAVSAELKMNNPVVMEGFGTLKTDIRPEYILLDQETNERYLMPPDVEIIFDALPQENEENMLSHAGFTPDEALYNEVNSSFSQFEPTRLNEDAHFPGIPEIVAGNFEEETDTADLPDTVVSSVSSVSSDLPGLSDLPEESVTGDAPEVLHEKIQHPVFPPGSRSRSRSRRELRSNKRTSSVWIPIAGGVAIVVASLFFFKGNRDG